MTIEKWLSDVYYDFFGTHIWNREDKDGGSQLVADIRGWGRLQNEFKTEEEAAKFQDEIGEFIAQAIREKIVRTSSQTVSDEEIEKESYIKFPILTYSVMEGHDDLNRHLRDSWVEGIKWYREQLNNLKLK